MGNPDNRDTVRQRWYGVLMRGVSLCFVCGECCLLYGRSACVPLESIGSRFAVTRLQRQSPARRLAVASVTLLWAWTTLLSTRGFSGSMSRMAGSSPSARQPPPLWSGSTGLAALTWTRFLLCKKPSRVEVGGCPADHSKKV